MGYCLDKRQVMPAKALEKAMTWATAKAGDAGQRVGKGNDVSYCHEKRQVTPAKALEKAMARATALTKGR